MEIGMLWFDDGPASLRDKVRRAVDYYVGKHGRKPTLCLVHPDSLNGHEGEVVAGVELRKGRAIRPNHLWIGEGEEGGEGGRRRKRAAAEGKS